MPKNNPLLNMKIFTSDEFPFEVRILNFVCFFGALSASIALVMRIVERMPFITIAIMCVMVATVLAVLRFSVLRAKRVRLVTNLVVYSLGVVLFPLVYFTNGGEDSGLPAYFTLAIIIDFLLLQGKSRVIALIMTSAVIVFCYVSTMFWGWSVIPAGGLSRTQRFVDILQSVFVSGFFIGCVIVFQNNVYLREKHKAESAGAEIRRNEKMLKLVNEAATLLLTTEPDRFESVLTESMEKMAVHEGFDRVYIWHAEEREGLPIYRQIYGWLSPSASRSLTFEAKYGTDWIPRIEEWDALFRKHAYVSAVAGTFPEAVRTQLLTCEVRALMVFPVNLQDQFWGFVSFDNCHSDELCSDQEAAILQSGSLLLANAVERNEHLRVRDIMEQERAAALEQAINANRAKSDFLSHMSHEMRTPMNAIIGMTTIGQAAQSLKKKDYAFGKIDNASRHLLGVINDILDMSKIEANKLELADVGFEFDKLLQKVVSVINFRVTERRQKLYVNIDKNIPFAFIGDDQRLAQVIANLLANAVKFTPESGVIHLDASLLSEEDGRCRLRISVTDNGIGIAKEQQARLFRSFAQAEAGTSRTYGGTGLGLAISRRIVELMGGEIWIESEPGQGAKFSFTVELKRDPRVCRYRLAKGVNWSDIRIFVVGDTPEVSEFFTNMAANLGIACTVAANGEDALELLQVRNPYHVHFLDWKLPGMSGIDLARNIREKLPENSVVLMFSSTDWSLIEDEARAAGIDRFLPKPLFQSDIVDLLNEIVGLEKAAEQHDKNGQSVDFTGHSILLVEDIEINREIAQALLQPVHLEVNCAENGMEALRMFAEAPDKYSMILMDVQMPVLDGYEATRQIRALDIPRAREIPIVAMTANVFREDIDRCLEAGMNAHVGKPINIDELLAVLKTYLTADR